MGKRVYRVKKGDDFIKISRKLYGDPSYVMDLMRANPGFNWVGPGMVLRLPINYQDWLAASIATWTCSETMFPYAMNGCKRL